MPNDAIKLFLPLTEEKATTLITSPALVPAATAHWSVAEIAAISVIQNVAAFHGQPDRVSLVEKALAQLIDIGNGIELNAPNTFAGVMARRFIVESFKAGLEVLPSIPARLLDSEALEAAGYLLPTGEWDFAFGIKHHAILSPYTEAFKVGEGLGFKLTTQQARSFRIFQTEMDESLHVQAVAGSGKTFMIEKMIDGLKDYNPLLLAYTNTQLRALMARVGSSRVKGMTFGELAKEALERDRLKTYRRGGHRARISHQVDKAEVAKRLGFTAVGPLTPSQVASLCNRMVVSFCFGKDVSIDARHIPEIGQALTELDKLVLVQFANTLWKQTIEPSGFEYDLPLRGYHRIKHLSLAEDTYIDPIYTHVIVDESHDLSWAMSAFLDRCSQPVITLGDASQRLDGHWNRRGEHVRKREIYQSVRAGRQVESVVNTLIERNPIVRVPQMEGSRDIDTKIVQYDIAQIPTEPSTILVNSEWGLFEWFQRLGNAGADFCFIGDAGKAIRRFVVDCIELYQRGIRPNHSALFKYTSWEKLRKDMGGDPAFRNIERMLAKGYDAANLESALARLDSTGSARYKLGRVVDAKNTEIKCVMLAPDLLIDVTPGNKTAAASAFANIFTGGTRARYRLIVPGYLKDWAADLAVKAGR